MRDPDDTENDVDSDLEEGIQAVIEGRGVDKTDPLEVIQSTEFNEWQKFEAVSRYKFLFNKFYCNILKVFKFKIHAYAIAFLIKSMFF